MHGIIAEEEQAPLDLFLVSIETRSFIFAGMDIRPIDPPSPSAPASRVRRMPRSSSEYEIRAYARLGKARGGTGMSRGIGC